MPKRVVDGEGLWQSHKLAAVQPAWVRAEYGWLYPVAEPNGVFELDARSIWARCYAFNREDKSVDDVEVIFSAFAKAKLLFVWEQGGKRFGYWTGSEKPGRRPRPSWLERLRCKGKLPPDPPPEQLNQFLNPRQNGDVTGTSTACNKHAEGVLGFGTGTGEILLSQPIGCSDPSVPPPEPGTEVPLTDRDSLDLECLDAERRLSGSTTTEAELREGAVRRVWTYFLEKLKKNPKLLAFTRARQQKGMARLREALAKTAGNLEKAEELMQIVVDTIAESPWHMGDNPQKKRYNSWEDNLFKSQEQFEKWLERANGR